MGGNNGTEHRAALGRVNAGPVGFRKVTACVFLAGKETGKRAVVEEQNGRAVMR